jgi:hypothetical protein
MTIKLGDSAKDSISGLTGVVVARYEYLNGCVRLAIQPREIKDGKPVEASVFDVEQVEFLSAAAPRTVEPKGGPHTDPAPRSSPSR